MVTKLPFLCLTSEYYSLSALSAKLYFLEIGPVHQKLWPFKCMMLKMLNSNVLDREDTLKLVRMKTDVATNTLRIHPSSS